MCVMNPIYMPGTTGCFIQIEEPDESVLIGQRQILECHTQGIWEWATCTLNGDVNKVGSKITSDTCQLDILAETLGENLVECTMSCTDGTSSTSAVNVAVIGRCALAYMYLTST